MPYRSSYAIRINKIFKAEPEREVFSFSYIRKCLTESYPGINPLIMKRHAKSALDKMIAAKKIVAVRSSYKIVRDRKPARETVKRSSRAVRKAEPTKRSKKVVRAPAAAFSPFVPINNNVSMAPISGSFADRQPQSTGQDTGMTELIFAFDTTGSMRGAIAEVKKKVEETMTRLYRDTPLIRIGLIAHGDYCDGQEKAFRSHDFVDARGCDELKKWLQSDLSTGGGDGDENYEMVLEQAHSDKFSWTVGSRRILVMIGDASPHSSDECLRQMTTYNIPNPRAIDWRTETDRCYDKGIKIYSVGVNVSLPFHQEIAERTCGTHFLMRGFESMADMILTLCFREHSGGRHYEGFVKEVEAAGRMTENMRRIVRQLSGPITEASAITA